jgi:signal transduction histidine kinase
VKSPSDIECSGPAPPPDARESAELHVNYRALLARSPDNVVLIDIDRGCLVDANRGACALFGLDEQALLTRAFVQLCPPCQSDGQASAQLLASHIHNALAGGDGMFEAQFLGPADRPITCEVRLLPLPPPHRHLMHARFVDITRRLLDDELRHGQNRLLDMIARGKPLKDILDSLMLLIEGQSDSLLCSVMLLDADGVTIRSASGPSLPPEFLATLDGAAIGPCTGSCGTAIYRGETVIVTDVMTDPLWAHYRHLVAPYGLRACWSTPIHGDGQRILGSFAMYYRDSRPPAEDDTRLLGVATHLAAIAIERTRREAELAQHRDHLQELVAARTAALSRAQEELVRRDKLAALGALVAGVAHELNTPIGNSLMAATSLAEKTRALAGSMESGLRRSQLVQFLTQADEAAQILARNLQRAARLLASFRQVAADPGSSERRAFMLCELVAELLPPLRILARQRGVDIDTDVAPGLAMDSYPGPLAEVLTHLVDNCLVHAFAGTAHGTIVIGALAGPDASVLISVSDNGAGIAPPLAPRVYDPFVTARLGSSGPGLGLHVVHNIVSGVLGGNIELDSELGKGSTFRLRLPAIAPGRASEPGGQSAARTRHT